MSLAGGLVLSAQIQLPSAPPRQFGASITGAYEGWFDNADGTHSFLVGYYNRNTAQELDVPIGPNNRIEPGGPDMGQPTHFLPGRHTGMFIVTVPKEFTKEQRLTWTITANGVTNSIPLRTADRLQHQPVRTASSQQHAAGRCGCSTRRRRRFRGRLRPATKAVARTATVAAGLSIPLWADDDAKYSSGTSAPMRRPGRRSTSRCRSTADRARSPSTRTSPSCRR